MNIPFHISLGSSPITEETKLIEKNNEICTNNRCFNIHIDKIGSLGNKVVFVEPIVNNELIKLHLQFYNNFADGFPWYAHTTLFMDDNEENVNNARNIEISNFTTFNAKIIGIQLGEFFPTRMILKKNL